jgi:Fusaric acid resistance protein family
MRVGCWQTLSMPAIGRTLAFVVANTVAGLVALYIGCANNLERPYWAVCTLFIVAKPITGAVRSRAGGIAALGAQRPTQAVEDGESALVGLRLDLTSFRGHQLSPPRTP